MHLELPICGNQVMRATLDQDYERLPSTCSIVHTCIPAVCLRREYTRGAVTETIIACAISHVCAGPPS